MKKTIAILGFFSIIVIKPQTIQAQHENNFTVKIENDAMTEASQKAEQELTSTLQQYGYKILKLSPCKIHIKKNISADAYTEYIFAPNKASWDGTSFGLRADWTIIKEKKYFQGKTNTENKFILPFVNDNQAIHDGIADQINTLANFCRLEIKPNEITDDDLFLFLITEQEHIKESESLREQIKKDLAHYHTEPDKLLEIHLFKSYEQSPDDYTETELAEEAEASEILKAYFDQTWEQYNEYFESERATMPERQYRTIGMELSYDKYLVERARKIRDKKINNIHIETE